jgi:hypothetical protein
MVSTNQLQQKVEKVVTYLALLSSEEWKQELMIIQLDIIVFRIPTVNLSFNLISIVI